ncbi:hypothetical protein TeGR_g10998 [Tetraparma gracilis]|uniref:Uncharacterized protein n=1 Tax=Tetraparma gracilis TaxID=2962635 RepID=A0ABQ6M9D4_9STRA|nr:hypothetical protein TeGR_g10998 [Tetraparma gracilis]
MQARCGSPPALLAALARSPTALTYGAGAAGRLEYFRAGRGRMPGAGEVVVLVRCAAREVELWGPGRGGDPARAPKVGYKEFLARRLLEGDGRAALFEEDVEEGMRAGLFPPGTVGRGDPPAPSAAAADLAAALTAAQLERLYGYRLRSDEVMRRRLLAPASPEPPPELRDPLGLLLAAAVVSKARADELRVRAALVSSSGAGDRFRRVLPTADVDAITGERPGALLPFGDDLEMRVENLSSLFGPTVDLGSLVTRCPEIMLADFEQVRSRFAEILDCMSVPYSSVSRLFSKEPSLLLLPTASTAAKIKYLSSIITPEQQPELMSLLVRQPSLLTRPPAALCRLEYLRDCGATTPPAGSFASMGLVSPAMSREQQDDGCSVDEPPLLVGHVPAVLGRAVEVMAERHPFYGFYLRERVGGRMASGGVDEWERTWGAELLRPFM